MTDRGGLIARLRTFAAEQTPALAAGRAVLAASGGGDSTAMVALLCEAGIVRADGRGRALRSRLRGVDAALPSGRRSRRCARATGWSSRRERGGSRCEARRRRVRLGMRFWLASPVRAGRRRRDGAHVGRPARDGGDAQPARRGAARAGGDGGRRAMAVRRRGRGCCGRCCACRARRRARTARREGLAFADDAEQRGSRRILRNRVRHESAAAAGGDGAGRRREALLRLAADAREGHRGAGRSVAAGALLDDEPHERHAVSVARRAAGDCRRRSCRTRTGWRWCGCGATRVTSSGGTTRCWRARRGARRDRRSSCRSGVVVTVDPDAVVVSIGARSAGERSVRRRWRCRSRAWSGRGRCRWRRATAIGATVVRAAGGCGGAGPAAGRSAAAGGDAGRAQEAAGLLRRPEGAAT